MRLQQCVSHRPQGKEYVKHQIVIPNNIVQRLGWTHGDKLDGRVCARGLLLYRITPEPKREKLTYDEFKGVVISVLSACPNGCVWSELRQLANLHQKTPSPLWVKRLEDEHLLTRVQDAVTSQTIWRLTQRASGQVKGLLNGWIS